jgi:GNAT superfamily N-acetyltransferase
MDRTSGNRSVRVAIQGDADAIAILSGQLGYPSDAAEIRSRLEHIRDRGDGQVFVAVVEGAVAGWIHVFGAHVLETPPHAEIGGLVVEQASRGVGIGTLLMRTAENWAVSAGYSTVSFRSNVVRTAAHRLYDRIGYRRIKRQVMFEKVVASRRLA